MKTIVCTKYGAPEVLQMKETKKPTPKSNEVLIKVNAVTVTLYDCWGRSGTAPPGFLLLNRLVSGIRKPKHPILGTELSGEIEAVGNEVKRFKVGDQVFAFNGMNTGCYVEFICFPENGMVTQKPSNITFEEAAAIPYGGLTALHFLRAANIQKGQKVLIFGASGGVGSFAVQIAKYFGAEVTGVCSTKKLEFVKSLGADKVFDYTKEDFSKSGVQYDVIFDTIGKSPFSGSKKSLKKEGYYIFATFGLLRVFRLLWLKLTSNKKVRLGVVEEKIDEFNFLKVLVETGKLRVIIDKQFPFDQIVEAHRYAESRQAQGKIVVTVEHD